MDNEQLTAMLDRYMRAAISLHIGKPVHDWPIQLVDDAFDLLPPQPVQFPEWARVRGYDVTADAQAAVNKTSLAILESNHGVKRDG